LNVCQESTCRFSQPDLVAFFVGKCLPCISQQRDVDLGPPGLDRVPYPSIRGSSRLVLISARFKNSKTLCTSNVLSQNTKLSIFCMSEFIMPVEAVNSTLCFQFSECFLLGHLWEGHPSEAICIETIPHRGTSWRAGALTRN
jgi:hypothetical protein